LTLLFLSSIALKKLINKSLCIIIKCLLDSAGPIARLMMFQKERKKKKEKMFANVSYHVALLCWSVP